MGPTPDWAFQTLWFTAGIGGTGAVWFFLSRGQSHHALWTGLATAVLVCFVVALHIRNDLLRRESVGRSGHKAPGPVATGPFPPFSLGGSLAKEDLFDYVSRGFGTSWLPVKKAIDAEVDWSQFAETPLNVDALVRGGWCQLGLLDVENEIVVATSDWLGPRITELGWDAIPSQPDLLEDLKTVRFAIPPAIGRKKYRLVVRTRESGQRTFWVAGAITFPIVELGGTFGSQFQASDTSIAGPAPESVEAVIDWGAIRDPMNTVVAEVTLAAWYPVFQTRERARAIIRDLTDNTTVTTDWMDVSWTGGMMASTRPYRGPSKQRFKLGLPRKTGIHTYVLEVEASTSGMRLSARGSLMLRH